MCGYYLTKSMQIDFDFPCSRFVCNELRVPALWKIRVHCRQYQNWDLYVCTFFISQLNVNWFWDLRKCPDLQMESRVWMAKPIQPICRPYTWISVLVEAFSISYSSRLEIILKRVNFGKEVPKRRCRVPNTFPTCNSKSPNPFSIFAGQNSKIA